MMQIETCRDCMGSGEIGLGHHQTCPRCNGQGGIFVRTPAVIKTKIVNTDLRKVELRVLAITHFDRPAMMALVYGRRPANLYPK